MIAINWSSYRKYGCPNCGCDSITIDNFYLSNQPCGTCRSCNLHYQIMEDGITKSSVRFNTGRKDENGDDIFERPVFISHPRNGIPCWHYEKPDIRPEYGEYWNPRGIGYDLSGFVKSKQAGERLLQMVKEVLGKENPDSWLDYRDYEPNWIQFKIQNTEFDLEKLEKMVIANDKIITKEILVACKL